MNWSDNLLSMGHIYLIRLIKFVHPKCWNDDIDQYSIVLKTSPTDTDEVSYDLGESGKNAESKLHKLIHT